MKQFIQLEIKKDHGALMELLDKMIKTPTVDYCYNQEMSDNANNDRVGVGLEGFEYAVFSSAKDYLFFSNVFVWVKDDELKVFNIGSNDARFSNLGKERYNHVIEDFYHNYIARFLDSSFKGCVKMTGDEMMMELTLGKELYDVLHLWESNCNKSAPIANPCDGERWFEFVSRLYESGIELDSSVFGQWLSEECGWSSAYHDSIFDMEKKLEYAISLLKYYGGRAQ